MSDRLVLGGVLALRPVSLCPERADSFNWPGTAALHISYHDINSLSSGLRGEVICAQGASLWITV